MNKFAFYFNNILRIGIKECDKRVGLWLISIQFILAINTSDVEGRKDWTTKKNKKYRNLCKLMTGISKYFWKRQFQNIYVNWMQIGKLIIITLKYMFQL